MFQKKDIFWYLFLVVDILAFFFFFFFIYKFIFLDKEIVKKTVEYNLKQVDFKLNNDTYFVAKNNLFAIDIHNPENIEYTIKINNEQVAYVDGSFIVANKYGETKFSILVGDTSIYDGKIYVVKGITNRPKEFDKNKERIKCDYFTEYENYILDLTLKDRIAKVGYKTRAGAVEAARFITLEFDKRVPYFYENGRLNNHSGQNYVDGEGRYYHEGLYLNSSRYADLAATYTGPAAWGCELSQYKGAAGNKSPNGLDCSGFVSWALLNGGFDVKDSGAGDIPGRKDDLYDLGVKEKITNELINSDKVKVGDLIAYNGHMAIIVGIDSEHFYVAESLPNFKGVAINRYKKIHLIGNFTHIMLMDSVYLNDGILTDMWY